MDAPSRELPSRELPSLGVGDPVRPQAGRALLAAGAAVVAFCVFALVTTQVKSVRAGSPWQDDPYDMVVSFTALIVPALAALVAARVLTCRKDRPLPVHRLRQLLAAATIAVVLVAVTIAADVAAAALHADAALWNGDTGWLVAALVPVGGAALASCWLIHGACSRLPARVAAGEGDWLDDLVLLLDLVSERVTGRAAPSALCRWAGAVSAFVRRHVILVALGLAAAISLADTSAEALGEGWTSPLLFVTAWAIGAGAIAAAALLANSALHVAVRPPRPRGSVPAALGRAAVVAALALPLAAGFRDAIWAALGRSGGVGSPAQFAAVTFGAAALAFCLAALAALAGVLSRRVLSASAASRQPRAGRSGR